MTQPLFSSAARPRRRFVLVVSGAVALLGLRPGVAHAQIGIGTATPNPKAALDISALNKGLLIPRMDSAVRARIATPPDGLMVFQNDGRKGFWYALGGQWLYIPDKTRSGDNLGDHTARRPLALNSYPLRLRTPTDAAQELSWQNNWANYSIDGPVLVGNGGGALGTRHNNTSAVALFWDNIGQIGIGRTPALPSSDPFQLDLYSHNARTTRLTSDHPDGTILSLTNDQYASGFLLMVSGGNSAIGPKKLAITPGYNTLFNTPAFVMNEVNSWIGLGTASPRGRFDVAGTGDTYLVSDPDNGTQQNLFLPGHVYLAPHNGTGGTAYLQARALAPSPTTNIGLQLRTTQNGQIVDALAIAPNGDVTIPGQVKMGYVYVERTDQIPGVQVVQFTLSCPSGTTLIGGGGGHRDLNMAASEVIVHYNGPAPTDPSHTWRLTLSNSSVSSRTTRIYCICARMQE